MTDAWLKAVSTKARKSMCIDKSEYEAHKVMRGLRNPNGTGVLVGLTNVGAVDGYELIDGIKMPAPGRLYYQGFDLFDLVNGFQTGKRHGFEETAYLLLFGELPSSEELAEFNQKLDQYRTLPADFTENMILKNPSSDIMNKLMRSVLVMFSYDEDPDSTELTNLIRQSIKLIAQFPTIIAYGYQAKAHYFNKESLIIHAPKPGIGTAENILQLIRADQKYSTLEADILDLCLVLHAEHGGGNNSTFATHVVASSGTDTYSCIATALGSLKGPKHGGANIMVKNMVDDFMATHDDWQDTAVLESYLRKVLRGEAFDGSGLIYGLGHAVYTLSDPRAIILKEKARQLAEEKGSQDLFALYESIEKTGLRLLSTKKTTADSVCANVDLYSGFVYDQLGIPKELYTPLFAASRITGWCAHRMEQLLTDPKIMRPAYMSTVTPKDYVGIDER
jgi:citrate synthase